VISFCGIVLFEIVVILFTILVFDSLILFGVGIGDILFFDVGIGDTLLVDDTLFFGNNILDGVLIGELIGTLICGLIGGLIDNTEDLKINTNPTRHRI